MGKISKKVGFIKDLQNTLNKLDSLKNSGYCFDITTENFHDLLKCISNKPPPPSSQKTINKKTENLNTEKITKISKRYFIENYTNEKNNSNFIRLIRKILILLGFAKLLSKLFNVDISNEKPIKKAIETNLKELIDEINHFKDTEKEKFFKKLEKKLYETVSINDILSVNILLNIFKKQQIQNNETLNKLIKIFEKQKDHINLYKNISSKYITTKIPRTVKIPLILELAKEFKKQTENSSPTETNYIPPPKNTEVFFSEQTQIDNGGEMPAKLKLRHIDGSEITFCGTNNIEKLKKNMPKDILINQINIALNIISIQTFDGILSALLKKSKNLPKFFKEETKLKDNFSTKFGGAVCKEKLFIVDKNNNITVKISGYLKFFIENTHKNPFLLKNTKFSFEFSLKKIFETQKKSTLTFRKRF